MKTKISMVLTLSLVFVTEGFVVPGFAVPLTDSAEISLSQITRLQSLTAPGQIPIGTVVPWPSDQKIPEPMWLPCNGQNISPGSPLAKAIGSLTVPDLNGFSNTSDSNGKGFFIRGGAIALVTSTDSLREQYHGQIDHIHQVRMEIKNPNVSGTAHGQVYYDWVTGKGSGLSDSPSERALYKAVVGDSNKFRKFQYRIDTGEIWGDSHLENGNIQGNNVKDTINASRAAGYYSAPGDPYFFGSSNILGGMAFTIPKGPEVDRFIDHDQGIVYFKISHEEADKNDFRFTRGVLGWTRFLGSTTDKTEGGHIQDKSGGLADTTIAGKPGKLPIEYDGDDDYEYEGEYETTPQYKNVVYIIKAMP